MSARSEHTGAQGPEYAKGQPASRSRVSQKAACALISAIAMLLLLYGASLSAIVRMTLPFGQ